MAEPTRPFSNGTELMAFYEGWCERCRCDEAYRHSGDGEDSCPILQRAVSDAPTPELVVQDDFSVRCTAFEPLDPDDVPWPVEGQRGLFEDAQTPPTAR